MWNYDNEPQNELLTHFRKTPHQKANVLYGFGNISDAEPLYTDTIRRFIPKLQKAHTTRSSDVVLQFASRLALYAFRSNAQAILDTLWLNYPLSYDWSHLSGRSIQNIAIIGLLAQKERTPEFQPIVSLLPEGHLLRHTIEVFVHHHSIDEVKQQFDVIFESASEVATTPWSDEPLLGVYERLHQIHHLNWLG